MPSRAQQKESRRQERIASEQARQELARRRPESTPTTEIDIERFSEEARAFWSLAHTMGLIVASRTSPMRLSRQGSSLPTSIVCAYLPKRSISPSSYSISPVRRSLIYLM